MSEYPADQNPYGAPQTAPAAPQISSVEAKRLLAIAKGQSMVCWAILFGLICNGIAYAIQSRLQAPASRLTVLAVLAVLLLAAAVQATAMYKLARWAYDSVASGVVMAILALLGCIGLLVLAFANSKATQILKKNGVHVGFMGPPASEIRRLEHWQERTRPWNEPQVGTS